MFSFHFLAVQCERKPLVLSSTVSGQFQGCRNKTIGLDYQTSSDESDEDKRSDKSGKTTFTTNSDSSSPQTKFRPPSHGNGEGPFSNEMSVDSRTNSALLEDSSVINSSRYDPSVGISHTGSTPTTYSENFVKKENIPFPDEPELDIHAEKETGTDSRDNNRDSRSIDDLNCEMPPLEKYDPTYERIDSNENVDVESIGCIKENNHHRELKQPLSIPILSGSKIFRLEPPSISTTDVGYLYEISTRLLFSTLDWVQGLACFHELHNIDRFNLLLNRWYSLFILGMAQHSSMFPVSTMLFLANSAHEPENGRRHHAPPLRWSTFVKLKDVVMNGDLNSKLSKEIYDYMKIITLFDQGKCGQGHFFINFVPFVSF